jgi:hypothetical protein
LAFSFSAAFAAAPVSSRATISSIEKHHRHGHHLALRHFVLEQGAVDHRALDAGIQHGHQVEGLHDIRAVMAGQRDKGLEAEYALDRLDLTDQFGIDLGWMTAGLQQ